MLKDIIEEFNENLKATVKGYKAMSLCNIETAETLFSESLDPEFDIDLISACNLELVRVKLNTLKILGRNNALNDVVINLDNELHIIDITDSKKYFIYLAIDGEEVKRELVKHLLDVYKIKLNESINDNLL